jgi:putative hydrolase of the HAD superfamily
MAEIRLVTFDLDNTLWDVGVVLRHAEEKMHAFLDQQVPEYRRLLDPEAIMDIRRDVIRELPHAAHDVSALREQVLYRSVLRCGYPDAEARSHARAAFEAFFEARQEVVFFDHALEALAHLSGRYRLAALTNGNADIRRMGLARYFSFAISAADVAASKPAPDIFHAALERAGATPGESIHVGDNAIDDIKGASDVGMHTIWVRHPGLTNDSDDIAASAVVEHLRDLASAVARIHDD